MEKILISYDMDGNELFVGRKAESDMLCIEYEIVEVLENNMVKRKDGNDNVFELNGEDLFVVTDENGEYY